MSGFNHEDRRLPPPQSPSPQRPVPLEPGLPTTLWYDHKGRVVMTGKVIELTKHFEGLVLTAMDDGYGTPTVGYGRIKYPDGRKVKNGDKCRDEKEATEWLVHDLYSEGAHYVRAYVDDNVEAKLSNDEFAVWVDLTFNRGAGRFRENIAQILNKQTFAKAAEALTEDHDLKTAGGKYNLGLDRRRWAERYILEGKDWTVFKSLAYFKQFKNNGYRA